MYRYSCSGLDKRLLNCDFLMEFLTSSSTLKPYFHLRFSCSLVLFLRPCCREYSNLSEKLRIISSTCLIMYRSFFSWIRIRKLSSNRFELAPVCTLAFLSWNILSSTSAIVCSAIWTLDASSEKRPFGLLQLTLQVSLF